LYGGNGVEKKRRIQPDIAVLVSGLVVLWLLSRKNYLLFHTVIEFVAIVAAVIMAILGIGLRRISKNDLLYKLGWLYAFVSIVDLLHTLAYKGMGVFPNWTANHPTQLWILGRLIETAGLFVILFFPRLKNSVFVFTLFVVMPAGITSVALGFFPDCFVPGKGLTSFKVMMEYFMVFLLLAAYAKLARTKDPQISPIKKAYGYALFFTMAAELSFTLYTDVYGFLNMLGHLFRFVSYYVLLRMMALKALTEPFEFLFSSLMNEKRKYEELAYRDSLTGLYNRHFFNEWIESHTKRQDLNQRKSALLLMDLNGFKQINDKYGHLHGDSVLKYFADVIKKNTRSTDFAIRFGGDEFLLVLPDTDATTAQKLAERMAEYIDSTNPFEHPVSFSYGVESFTDWQSYLNAIKKADEMLYRMKNCAQKNSSDL